jgi:hypothetical protein
VSSPAEVREPSRPGAAEGGAARDAVPPLRLDGWRLRAARVVWLVGTVGSTALVVAGFGRAFADPQLVALPALTDLFTEFGLDLRVMIAVALVVPFATVVIISGLVYRRRSHDPMALLFAMMLLLLYAFASRTPLTFADHHVLRHAVSVLFAAATICLLLVLSLFPDGRRTPPWSGWLPVGATAFLIAFPESGRLLMDLIAGDLEAAGPSRGIAAGLSVLLALGLLAQIHRYRHVSGVTERQQAKWVVFPLAALVTLFTFVLLLGLRPGPPDRWVGFVLLVAVPLGVVVPLMVANAVLRHRLFEIDRAISRTVAYTLLTAVLVAVYAGGVTALGAIVRLLTGGGGDDLVVAASTLAVAALFHPLRRRMQRLVDRRFNRLRYDAHRTIEVFGQRLRDEVDLAALVADLGDTAAAVLQPCHVSVWLPEERP